jgi:hypothetical protein
VYIPQVAAFQADLAGPNGTSGVGQITQPVTSNSGVVVNNFGAFVGTPFESNTNYAARCRAKLAALSPSGPGDAYRYFATTANTILAAQTPPVALSAPITQAIVSQSLATGITTTYVANVTGAVSGCVQLPVTGATNASPIVISTSSAHGLSTGQYAKISGVQGNTAANNTPTNATWTITYVDATHFSLNNSTGNATYVGGGYIEGGDLGLVDSVIQANVVPDATTAIVASAANWNVNIIATVQVAAAYANTYAANVQVALATYFATIPIGGGTVGVIEYNNVIGVLYAAGIVSASSPQVVAITTLTLNGTSGNISFPTPYSIAQLSPTPIITVVSV